MNTSLDLSALSKLDINTLIEIEESQLLTSEQLKNAMPLIKGNNEKRANYIKELKAYL